MMSALAWNSSSLEGSRFLLPQRKAFRTALPRCFHATGANIACMVPSAGQRFFPSSWSLATPPSVKEAKSNCTNFANLCPRRFFLLLSTVAGCAFSIPAKAEPLLAPLSTFGATAQTGARMSSTDSQMEALPDMQGGEEKQLLKVVVVGDVMLGRLVDQIFPTHNEEPENHFHAEMLWLRDPDSAARYQAQGPYRYVWGNTLPLFHSADLRLANLETSLTSYPEKWPGQAFNFRAHPDNVRALQEARIDFVSLANNHILDFKVPGMLETQRTLDAAGIRWAGAGGSLEEAARPAMLQLGDKRVACFAMSDHFPYWAAGPDSPGLWLVDPGRHRAAQLDFIRRQVARAREEGGADLVFFSIHWGPNWSWRPSPGIRQLAHDLVDTCGVDLIHGTSAHHIQGIEHYHGSVIIYGCGDFVDDYAVDQRFRSNLSFVYVIHLDPQTATWHHMELVPTKIRTLGVTQATEDDDREWLARVLARLSEEYGTKVEKHPGGGGRLLIKLSEEGKKPEAGA